MSNCERQRLFRERNPGYYQRLHAKRRALEKPVVEAMLAEARAMATKREPLMLPAPAVPIEIYGINSIPTRSDAEAVAVSVRVA
jgi:hypothetical protein